MTTTGKQLFTTLESDGTLTVEIAQSEFPDPTGNQVLVKKRVFPFAGMLTWMHVTFGISHEYPLHNFWGWLMLLTSVGVLVLGVTGVYLWFKIYRERLVGSILLFGNLLFVAVTALLWLG